jgi:DUF4097 and DUF4098 domain-containing protein YvlB
MKSIVLLTALLLVASAARASVTETFTHTYALNPDGAIRLDNVNGDIDITAWDKAEVSLVAEKRAKDDDELKRLEIIIEDSPAQLVIKTKYAKSLGWHFFGNWGNASVHYKLMVPAGARLEKIDSVNSGIEVSGVRGNVNLETVNGGIAARGLAGDARLASVNGSLRVDFESTDKVQEIKLESVNGRAEITLPKGAGASVKTSSVNGSTRVDQAIRLSKSGRHSLSGEIGSGGGPRIEIETVNGSISIREK